MQMWKKRPYKASIATCLSGDGIHKDEKSIGKWHMCSACCMRHVASTSSCHSWPAEVAMQVFAADPQPVGKFAPSMWNELIQKSVLESMEMSSCDEVVPNHLKSFPFAEDVCVSRKWSAWETNLQLATTLKYSYFPVDAWSSCRRQLQPVAISSHLWVGCKVVARVTQKRAVVLGSF